MDAMMFHQPWRLVQNRVRGKGGRELDTFRGIDPPVDDDSGSEAWVGSATHAMTFSDAKSYKGCSEVMLPGGTRAYLVDLIQQYPQEILGEAHVQKHGTELGVLVKFLDAKEDYGFQAHPKRPFAKRMWNSDFGKEESWYVLSTRSDVAEPSIILGFKEGITRKKFAGLYYAGDMQAITDTCHRIPVQAGDAFFVGGGVPHALGAGCFVIEVQEPSDITVIPVQQDQHRTMLSRFMPGARLPAREADSMYDEKVLGCFAYEGRSYADNLRQYKIPHQLIREGSWGQEFYIIGPEQTAFFSFTQISLHGETNVQQTSSPQIAIVLSGTGQMRFRGGQIDIKKGDELFLPYSIKPLQIRGTLDIVLCHPGGEKAKV